MKIEIFCYRYSRLTYVNKLLLLFHDIYSLFLYLKTGSLQVKRMKARRLFRKRLWMALDCFGSVTFIYCSVSRHTKYCFDDIIFLL